MKIEGSPANHTVTVADDKLVDLVHFGTLGEKKIIIHFKKDLPDGFSKYDYHVVKNSSEYMNLVMYRECGYQGYETNWVYRYWARDFPKDTTESGTFFSVVTTPKQPKKKWALFKI